MAFLKITFISLLTLYILVGLGVYFLQEKLIFLPEELDKDFSYNFPTAFEEHFLEMDDGAVINALHFKTDSAKGLILYFHGNAGSLQRWGEVVLPFVDQGFEVLIMDYRGYGKSVGERSYKTLLRDADRLYEFALNHTSEDQLIVFGRSLGSSFASYLAGKNNPSMLILETPFLSLGDMANRVAPIYPPSYFLRFNFKNHEALKGAECPIYIFHGTEDNVVPLESAQKLYETLDPDQAQFFVIEDGGHNNLSGFARYNEELNKILLGE
ncbi:MAG: alpha/beta fold hydrolase [Cyclobacteriaceae bacterium]